LYGHPPKLTPVKIKYKILKGANSKVPR
jgi:hypothetical protein